MEISAAILFIFYSEYQIWLKGHDYPQIAYQ